MQTLMLSHASRYIAGAVLLTIVGIEFGGWFMTRIVGGKVAMTPFQKTFARAGHAHAGVLVTLSLVTLILADAAALDGVLGWLATDRHPGGGGPDLGRLLLLVHGPRRGDEAEQADLAGVAGRPVTGGGRGDAGPGPADDELEDSGARQRPGGKCPNRRRARGSRKRQPREVGTAELGRCRNSETRRGPKPWKRGSRTTDSRSPNGRLAASRTAGLAHPDHNRASNADSRPTD